MRVFKQAVHLTGVLALLLSFNTNATTAMGLNGDGRTLEELHALMLEFDPELKLAETRVQKARDSVDVYKSQLLPQISLTSQLNTTRYDSDVAGYRYTGERNSIALNQVIFDKKVSSAIDQAEFEQLVVESQLDAMRQERLALLVERYLNLVKAQYDLNTVEEEFELLTRIGDQVRSLYEKKLISVVDLTNSEARIAQAAANLTGARAKFEIAQETLFESVGASAYGPINTINLLEFSPAIEETGYEYWSDLALNFSPVLKTKTFQVKRAEAALAQAESEHYPKLGLQASHQRTNIGSEFSRTTSNSASVLSLNLSVPIYLGGSTRAKTRVQESELAIAQEELRFTQMQVMREIRTALIDFKSTRSSQEAALASAETAKMARLAAEKSFEFGVVDTGAVLERIADQYSAERNSIELAYRLILSYFKLIKHTASIDDDLLAAISKG